VANPAEVATVYLWNDNVFEAPLYLTTKMLDMKYRRTEANAHRKLKHYCVLQSTAFGI
jgi:hypothetical protein